MSRTRPPYPADFRQQMVNLVRSGRSPEELARAFEPSAQTIRNWGSYRPPAIRASDTTGRPLELSRLRGQFQAWVLMYDKQRKRLQEMHRMQAPGSNAAPAIVMKGESIAGYYPILDDLTARCDRPQ